MIKNVTPLPYYRKLKVSESKGIIITPKKSIVIAFVIMFFLIKMDGVYCQIQDDSTIFSKTLKKLSIEELMNIEVTSISIRPEKLTEVASAIQVITNEDIKRSGVTRLPEALRLASNLQVSQANSHDWSITARGFAGLPSAGGIVANKLLVMIDGRSIYTPLFGGVYWDIQNIMLEDVERIEVVSGPGGTLWGANAVNGVINVITKSAKETQGLYASEAGGSFLQDFGEVRYGGRIGSKLFFRLYKQRFNQHSAILSGISSDTISSRWSLTQGGFRMDYYSSEKTTFTLQGDLYWGDQNREVTRTQTNGENVLARMTHLFSEKSTLNVQLYYDHAWRKTPNSKNPFFYDLRTYDIDINHRFSLGSHQSILYGLRYQMRQDKVPSGLIPLKRDMPLYSVFVQDEISIIPKRLTFTIGSKFLHNVFTGLEIQPSARLAWIQNECHTIWAAVSRAVRTPSRFDSDIITVKKFDSENVIAYELGYRERPLKQLSFSLAGFYNQYDKLRSIDSANTDSDPQLELVLANSQRAESWGFEFSGNYVIMEGWQLRGGYTYFNNKIWATNAMVIPLSEALESVDPKNQFMLQSVMDLPKNFQVDLTARYVDELPRVGVVSTPAYFTFDLRLAVMFKFIEVSVVGQNLLEDQHTESGLSRIPRAVYGRIICRF